MSSTVFRRTEKKYIVNSKQMEAIIGRCSGGIVPDSHGVSSICNIYFDTDDFSLIRTSLEKPVYKEKLRIRSYGVPTQSDNVFFEIKKKYKGIVSKRRVIMPLATIDDYVENGTLPDDDSQIFREIKYFMDYYSPSPKLFLAYDRTAFFGSDDELFRLTFDTDIRWRTDDLHLDHGDHGTKLLPEGTYIMEVKAPLSMPLEFAQLLGDLEIYPVSFSKYGTVYKTIIQEWI